MSKLNENTTNLQTILNSINELPNASSITVDDALSTSSTNPVQNKVVTTALNEKADINHTQSASTITGGNFTGTVKADRYAQSPGTYSLRNSAISTSVFNLIYEGEICWTYG